MVPRNVIVWTLCLSILVLLLTTCVQAQELTEVPASDILEQIENGEDIYYENVRITGELDLSEIELETVPNARSFGILRFDEEQELMIVESEITIIDSIFEYKVEFSLTQFRKPLEFPGTTLDVNFYGASFSEGVNFINTNFSGTADFRHTSFGSYAVFRGASFNCVLFSDASFDSEASVDGVNFKDVNFREDAWFHRVNFNDDVNFYNVSFNGDADFPNAIFGGDADFPNAIFGGDANFRGASFSGETFFRDSRFNGNASFSDTSFSGDANFRDVSFSGEANFRDASFSNHAYFRHVIFRGNANFMDAIFDNGAGFIDVNFSDNASFYCVNFNGYVNFHNVSFYDEADFQNAIFGGNSDFDFASFSGEANFQDAIFGGDSDFDFASFSGEANFRDASFSNHAYFRQAIFRDEASFQATEFNKVSFINTQFARVYFYNSDFKSLEVSWSSLKDVLASDGPTYIKIIKNFREMEQFEEADDATYQYRQLRQASKKWSPSKLMDVVAWVSCGYGVRPLHTIGLGVAIIMLFALIYWRGKGIRRLKEIGGDDNQVSFWDALYFSMVTFTTVGFGDWYPADRYRVLVMIEGFVGWLTLALFLVTLANVMIRP